MNCHALLQSHLAGAWLGTHWGQMPQGEGPPCRLLEAGQHQALAFTGCPYVSDHHREEQGKRLVESLTLEGVVAASGVRETPVEMPTSGRDQPGSPGDLLLLVHRWQSWLQADVGTKRVWWQTDTHSVGGLYPGEFPGLCLDPGPGYTYFAVLPSFTKMPHDIAIRTGTMARLECAAAGHPTPQIAWQKDGGTDFPAARERRMHVMPDDDVFFITDVKVDDMGVYSCTAQNLAGSISANATLTVLGSTPAPARICGAVSVCVWGVLNRQFLEQMVASL